MAVTTYKMQKSAQAFDGGVSAVTGAAKIVTVSVVGTFEPGDKFNLRLGDNNYGFLANPAGPVSFLLTLGKKMHAISDTLLEFSAIDNPRDWDTEFGIGAGFINMFNEFTGGEKLRALAAYSRYLAVFARRTIQVWAMDVDPARNSQIQALKNIGTLSPRSVVQIGDVDVFFLSDSGIRSLRSRDINNIAFSADIGNPIDDLILREIREAGATAEKAIGAIDPTDGRYWLVINGRIYVFSHFSQTKISAWSTYEPDFLPEGVATYDGRLYVRSAMGAHGSANSLGRLYLYGGDDNATYDDCPVEGVLPFLSAGAPATTKTFTGFDAVVEGQWTFEIGTNPEMPDARDVIGELWAPSFDMQRIPLDMAGAQASIRFTCTEPGYARLSTLALHYNPFESG